MAVQTIAQLVAVISADTSALNTRLDNVESKLKKSEEQFNNLAKAADKSATSAATSINKVTNATKEQQRAADNLAKFEYQTQQKSAQSYASYLQGRISETSAATSEYVRLANQYASVQRQIDNEVTASSKKANAQKVSDAKTANAEIANSENVLLQKTIERIKLQELAEKQAADAKDATAKEAEIAAEQQKAAVASLARYEYEQGNLSTQAYRVFLERRMASYAEYTTQWKSAASQLVAVDRSIEAERVSVAKAADDEILAHQKEIAAKRAAVEKEVNAEMAAWDKEYVASFVASMDEAAVAANAARQRGTNTRNAVGNGLGTAAAGATAVELGSAIMAANFDHQQTTLANNTLMSKDDIKQMRADTLALARETGQSSEDIAQGYMHIVNHGTEAKNVMKELRIANEEAVATGSSTSNVANALGQVLHIFGATSDQAPGYMDVLHHSAAAGNLFVEEFVTHAGKAFAIAAAMKDKFSDAATAISLLSKNGFDAAQAATQIQSLVAHIANPADKATKNIMALNEAYHKLNPNSKLDLMFDFSQQGIQAKGLLGIMKDLYTFTRGNASQIGGLVPAMRGGVGSDVLTQMFGRNGGKEIDSATKETNRLQTLNTGEETHGISQRMNTDSVQQFKKFVAVLQTDFIPVGEKAIQIFVRFEPAIEKTANTIIGLMNAFQKLPVPIQETVTAIGGLFILEKFTGLLAALRIPVALGAGLKVVTDGFLNIGKGAAFLEGSALAETFAGWGTTATAAGASLEVIGTALLGPVGLAIATTVVAIAGLALAWQNDFGHIREVTANAWYAVKKGATETYLVISDAEKAWVNYNKENALLVIDVWKNLWAEITQMGNAFKTGFINGFSAFGQGFVEAFHLEKAVSAFDNFFAEVKKNFANFTADLRGGASQIGFELSNWWSNTPAAKYLANLSDRATSIVGNGPGGFDSNGGGNFTGNGVSGFVSGIGSGVSAAGPLGAKSALAVDAEKANAAAGDCEHRARLVIQSSTHAFDSLFQATDGNGRITAKSVAEAMNARGLLQPFKPGMAVKPGDLLYSTSLGAARDTGHVSSIDSKGNRRDQYGANHFAESNYQYLFDPDYAKARMTGGQDTKPVSPSDLAASVAQDKARAEALKQAAKEARALDSSYKSHLASLLKIAAVGEGSVNPNAPSTKYRDSVNAETAQGGALFGISGAERSSLMSAATRADHAADLRKKLAEQSKVAKAYQVEMQKIADKVKSALLDMQYAPKLDAPSNEALKSAVNQEGGIQAWMKLGVKPSDIGPRRPDGRSDAQDALVRVQEINQSVNYAKQIRDIASAQKDETAAIIEGNKYSENYDARAVAIDKFNLAHQKLIDGINLEADAKQKLKDLQSINAERNTAGNNAIFAAGNNLDGQTSANDSKIQASLLSLKQLTMTTGDYAVAQWEASDAGKSMIATLGAESDKVIAYEQSLRNAVGQDASTKGSLQEQTLMNDLTKQSLELHASNPFDAWLKSFYTLQAVVTAGGKTTLGYMLPSGMDVSNMKQIYNMQQQQAQLQKAQEMRQQIVGSLSDAIGGSVFSALKPDAQGRGNLQSQLLQQQQEQEQYRVAEAQFKTQNPGDPNDPYINRLKLIQGEIDNTKKKLGDMGGSLSNTFKGIFSSIYTSFTQSLQKMAQSYLQSALLGYLNKQIGTGAGQVSGQGSGGFLGGIAGLVSTGLSLFGGKSAQSFAGGIVPGIGLSSGNMTSAGNIVPMFAKGGRFDGKSPIIVGDGGEPEIIVPDSPGTVIPMSKASSGVAGRSIAGGTTVIHQKLTQNISTPNPQSFRSSDRTQKQGIRRMFGR